MSRRFDQKNDFSGITRDKWLASVGRLPDSELAKLKRREQRFLIYRALKFAVLLPVAIYRGIANIVRVLAEFERLHSAPRRKVREGVGCVIDMQTWLVNGQNIHLGDFVKISAFSSVIAGASSTVRIGTNTIIGPGVTIVALNHGITLGDQPIRYQEWNESPVVIGDDVWIGANVVVLPGSAIGSGCVIGAGTTVTGIVPPEMVAYMRDGKMACKRRS